VGKYLNQFSINGATGLRLFMQSNRHKLNINVYQSQTSKQNMNNNVIDDAED
jgi:hypothetical protein